MQSTTRRITQPCHHLPHGNETFAQAQHHHLPQTAHLDKICQQLQKLHAFNSSECNALTQFHQHHHIILPFFIHALQFVFAALQV